MHSLLFICLAFVPIEDEIYYARCEGIALIEQFIGKGPAGPVNPECACHGTGRSGDGLGPCICGAGCACKKTKAMDPALLCQCGGSKTVDGKPCICGAICVCERAVVAADDTRQFAQNDASMLMRQPIFTPEGEFNPAVETAPADDELPAQLIIRGWASGCRYCESLKKKIRETANPLGWKIGDSADSQIRLMDVSRSETVPQVWLMKRGKKIKEWSGDQSDVMPLLRDLREAWDDVKKEDAARGLVAGVVGAGPNGNSTPAATGNAGVLNIRPQVTEALRNFRTRVGTSPSAITADWTRNGASVLRLGAKAAWKGSDVFGTAGRVEFKAIHPINLPTNAAAATYRLVGDNVLLDVEPMILNGAARRLDIQTGEQPVGFCGVDELLLAFNLFSLARDVVSLMQPHCDIILPGEIAATITVVGDQMFVAFDKPPTVRLTWLFTFDLVVQRVIVDEQELVLEFSGSRWVKSRTFKVQ